MYIVLWSDLMADVFALEKVLKHKGHPQNRKQQWLRLARIFRDQIDQTPSQRSIDQNRFPRTMSVWGLNTSQDGDYTTPLGNWFQCLITLKEEKLLLTLKCYFLYCNQCLGFLLYNSNSVSQKMFLHTIMHMKNLVPCLSINLFSYSFINTIFSTRAG